MDCFQTLSVLEVLIIGQIYRRKALVSFTVFNHIMNINVSTFGIQIKKSKLSKSLSLSLDFVFLQTAKLFKIGHMIK